MEVIDWLLDSDPYVAYATKINLLHQDRAGLTELRGAVLADPRIRKYLGDVADFNGRIITTHKNPELPIHKLNFLLDIGLDAELPEIRTAVGLILQSRDEFGIFKTVTNVPVHYGGTGQDSFAWALCDAPLMHAALIRAGVPYTVLREGAENMAALVRGNGFPCTVSKELGRFRGPGKKEDCCPYATLAMLRLFSLIPGYASSPMAAACIDVLLLLWEQSREQHPYMFFMGTDFRKLKAPAIWYDIIGVTDCLSRFDYARKDSRYREMIDVISAKADASGRFVPESVYLKCSEWDFGQKKKPSAWLTYLCTTILARTNGTNGDGSFLFTFAP
ncbi:MAG: hypothetical protein ACYCYM_13620 [Saccharofermentanales bacterium]